MKLSKKRLDKGLVHVYTGEGKGKTTASLGLALRACGHGLKTYMIQFMKKEGSGETLAAKNLPGLTIESYGQVQLIDKNHPTDVDIRLAWEALEKAKKILRGGHYDLVILDESILAVEYGLIGVKDLLDLIREKPTHVELVLTGRRAPPEIIAVADLVTDMREVKHPYRRGVKARKGIEY